MERMKIQLDQPVVLTRTIVGAEILDSISIHRGVVWGEAIRTDDSGVEDKTAFYLAFDAKPEDIPMGASTISPAAKARLTRVVTEFMEAVADALGETGVVPPSAKKAAPSASTGKV